MTFTTNPPPAEQNLVVFVERKENIVAQNKKFVAFFFFPNIYELLGADCISQSYVVIFSFACIHF
jgi:hypothetical protein